MPFKEALTARVGALLYAMKWRIIQDQHFGRQVRMLLRNVPRQHTIFMQEWRLFVGSDIQPPTHLHSHPAWNPEISEQLRNLPIKLLLLSGSWRVANPPIKTDCPRRSDLTKHSNFAYG
jgi:hypothetical protein